MPIGPCGMADTPLLCVQHLQRSVNSGDLWSDISIDVYPGEIWFVRGPSGVGKTLFLRAVACLDPLEVSYPVMHFQAGALLCGSPPPPPAGTCCVSWGDSCLEQQ